MSCIYQLQNLVSLSTMEEEYVVAIEVEKEMLWLQIFMEELRKQHNRSFLFIDS
jgi:hypothetical protein